MQVYQFLLILKQFYLCIIYLNITTQGRKPLTCFRTVIIKSFRGPVFLKHSVFSRIIKVHGDETRSTNRLMCRIPSSAALFVVAAKVVIIIITIVIISSSSRVPPPPVPTSMFSTSGRLSDYSFNRSQARTVDAVQYSLSQLVGRCGERKC